MLWMGQILHPVQGFVTGSMLPITRKQYDALVSAFGNESTKQPEP